MKLQRRVYATALLLAFAGLIGSCHGVDTAASGRMDVDTLPGGVVHVSNLGSGAWTSRTRWGWRLDLRVGAVGDSQEYAFEDVRYLEADRAGWVYVLDGRAQEIRVFDQTGGYVRTLGRRGSGPAEFRDALGMAFDESGLLWVVDAGNSRYSTWDTLGSLRQTFPRPARGFSGPWRGAMSPQRVFFEPSRLATPTGVRSAILVVRDGEIVDTLSLPRFAGQNVNFTVRLGGAQGRMSFPVPFTGRLIWSVGPNGEITWGISDDYTVTLVSAAGDTVMRIKRDAARAGVQPDDMEQALAELRAVTGDAGLRVPQAGEYYPFFTNLYRDDRGFLWVTVQLAQHELRATGTQFDVFDPEGRYLGRLVTGIELGSVFQVRGPWFYGLVRDSLDVPWVIRARVNRPDY